MKVQPGQSPAWNYMKYEIIQKVKCGCGESTIGYGIMDKMPVFVKICNQCKEKYRVIFTNKIIMEKDKIMKIEELKNGID